MKLKQIYEKIKSSQAHRDESAMQTVIDGERGLGFITLKVTTLPGKGDAFWNLVKTHNLKTIEVPSNKYEAYIYFQPEYERDAIELRDIAEKYGGYLAHDATKEDTRRIGELLGYETSDIDAFIKKNYGTL